MQNLSWYLNFDINDLNTLFKSQILPYEIDCYICSCGQHEFIIKKTLDSSISYICPNCENGSFLNAIKYHNNFTWYEKIENLFSEEFLLSLNPEIKFNEKQKQLSSNIIINIPSSIDLNSDKVSYSSKKIFEIKNNETDSLDYIVHVNFDLDFNISDEDRFFNKISEKDLINRNLYLLKYKAKILEKLKVLSKSDILKKTNSLEEFNFFLKYNNLLHTDFYLWEGIKILPQNEKLTVEDALSFISNYRKEKTLKKTIYKNYKTQMKKYKSYMLIYTYSLCRYISDVNILIRMIYIDLKEHLLFMENSMDIYLYVKFLADKFTEKQIEKLFINYSNNEPFWLVDTVALLSEVSDYIDNLKVSKCKYISLHTDIFEYHRIVLNEKLFKIEFDYEEEFLHACINIQKYEVKLPRNGVELYKWSNSLENCLSGYWKLIKEKKSVIYGFFENGKIKFAVEIRNNKLVQSKSKYNRDLQNKDISLISGWFKRHFTD